MNNTEDIPQYKALREKCEAVDIKDIRKGDVMLACIPGCDATLAKVTSAHTESPPPPAWAARGYTQRTVIRHEHGAEGATLIGISPCTVYREREI